MLQRRRGSSCAASRTIGGYAPMITVLNDWRSARREFRISTSVFEASTLLIDWGRVLFLTLLLNYNWAYRLARTLTIKLQPSLLSLFFSWNIHLFTRYLYSRLVCTNKCRIVQTSLRYWSTISARTPRMTDCHCCVRLVTRGWRDCVWFWFNHASRNVADTYDQLSSGESGNTWKTEIDVNVRI